LSQLGYLSLSNNHLTGPIPSEIGSLIQLLDFYLDNNQLTGVVPSSLARMVTLAYLHLHRNHLKGSLTFPLTSFPQLQQLFLHQNRLTGSLHLLFPSLSPSSSSNASRLLNLDVSDNLLSGSIPSSLFLAHRLQSISLSLNCFEHELPPTMCEATDANVISMDGLGSANGCKNVLTLPFPFTSVSLVQSIDGSIPECVWSMSNLKALNLAGNGLRGTIGSVSSMPSLWSLTLSHNYLSGEVPLWLQEQNMLRLDISHNKLTGDVDGFKHQKDVNSSSLIFEWGYQPNKNLTLSVNRLSGNLPSSFGKYANLDILSGNLFGCENLPKNDQNSESLSCGSEQYDQSMSVMGALLGLILCLVVVHHLLCVLVSSFRSGDKTQDDRQFMLNKRRFNLGLLFGYVRYYQTGPEQPESEIVSPSPSSHLLQSIVSFGSLLAQLMRSVCLLTVLCLLLSLPVYVLKQLDIESSNEGGETQYVTHTHMYNWLWTMAFVSGTTPAVILLVTCFVCLSYFHFIINRLGSSDKPAPLLSTLSPSLKSATKDQDHSLRVIVVWTIFLVNIAVVGTVNGLYIWSTLLHLTRDVRLCIQLSFALFSLLWSVVLRIGLPSQIKESRYGVWLFVCLNVMNSVMIPCAVTALSTPSCYQVSVDLTESDLVDSFAEIARAS
jgi:hypothetical protein